MSQKNNIISEPSSDKSTKTKNNKKTKPGILMLISTIVLILINGLLTFLTGSAKGNVGAALIGYIFAGVFVLPLIAILITSIWKSNRNQRSRTKAFLITSIVVMLLNIGSFMTLATDLSKEGHISPLDTFRL